MYTYDCLAVCGHLTGRGDQSLLSPQGRFYLVALKQNDIQGICGRMLEQHGLKGEVGFRSKLLLDIEGRIHSNNV